MSPWLIMMTAGVGLCLFLWFRRVRRVMEERKGILRTAAAQLKEYVSKAVRGDPELIRVLDRSDSIYRQAAYNYNRALTKPENFLPALLMGYQKEKLPL